MHTQGEKQKKSVYIHPQTTPTAILYIKIYCMCIAEYILYCKAYARFYTPQLLHLSSLSQKQAHT